VAIAVIGVAPIVLLVAGIFAFVALTQDGTIAVPNVTGSTLASATTQLESSGLRVGAVTRREGASTPDMVLSQRPEGSVQVAEGTQVDLVVSAVPTAGQARSG
jgi:serine/threonine-protein kinase